MSEYEYCIEKLSYLKLLPHPSMKLISKIKFNKKFHRVCSTHLSSLKVWGRRDFRWWRHDRVWMGSWIGLFLRNCQGNNPKKTRPFWWWLTFIYFNQPRNNLRDKLQSTSLCQIEHQIVYTNVTGEIGWLLARKTTKCWPGTAYFDYVTVEARYLDKA